MALEQQKRILLLNGVNLNMLGRREPDTYGAETLPAIERSLIEHAKQHSTTLDTFQSNREYELIEAIHNAVDQYDGIIINPGAFTHTSIALRDAFLSVDLPFFEVHISNIYRRESFRHHSYLSDIAAGVIIGVGTQGYHLALIGLIHLLDEQC